MICFSMSVRHSVGDLFDVDCESYDEFDSLFVQGLELVFHVDDFHGCFLLVVRRVALDAL